MFGSTEAAPGIRFRQDNDFFYLTGNEALNAVLVVDAPGGQSHLFIPKLTPTEIRYEGGNWLEERGAAIKYGFASIQPLSELHEFLARRRSVAGPLTLWTRLSERDEVSYGRVDAAVRTARRLNNPFAHQATPDAVRIEQIREMFPYYTLQDVTPHLDALRVIKTSREAEILRYNGRISAEAMRRAIEISAPGRYEYEFEAEATQWMLKHGLQSAAYPAIVASGPNGNQWHYEANGRQTSAGELDRHGLRRVARLPDHRHHAHVAGIGTLHRRAAEGLRLRARGAEGDHRGHQAGRRPATSSGRSRRTFSGSTVSTRAMPTSATTWACRCTTSATGTRRSQRAW